MIQLSVKKKLHSPTGDMLLDVDLTLKRGQVIGLYGKSGAGKNSLLRIMAGLFKPDHAHIDFGSQVWVDTQTDTYLRPQQRKIGFVFQDYALFPNMTVRQNLEFALKRGQDPTVVDELIEMGELGQLQDQYPNTLSGGQQQRVALARSLVQRPQLLLLDEPLSALDQAMRQKLRRHLLKLHRRFALTTILISHDQEELEQMADQVIVLEAGKVQRVGPPEQVFSDQPRNLLLRAHIAGISPEESGAWVSLQLPAQQLKIWLTAEQTRSLSPGQEVRVQTTATGWKVSVVGNAPD